MKTRIIGISAIFIVLCSAIMLYWWLHDKRFVWGFVGNEDDVVVHYDGCNIPIYAFRDDAETEFWGGRETYRPSRRLLLVLQDERFKYAMAVTSHLMMLACCWHGRNGTPLSGGFLFAIRLWIEHATFRMT